MGSEVGKRVDALARELETAEAALEVQREVIQAYCDSENAALKENESLRAALQRASAELRHAWKHRVYVSMHLAEFDVHLIERAIRICEKADDE